MAKSSVPSYEIINNFRFPAGIRENIEYSLNYSAQNTDKFLVTYPKSGTTWTQHILHLILNNGVIHESEKDFMWNSFIEWKGKDVVKYPVIKTHLPFELMPYNKSAKYLLVFRNPKDTCVSFYYHIKSITAHQFTGNFHDFFYYWIRGEVWYEDYFKHTLSLWSHRFDNNFSFLVYEHMKYNPRDAVLKIGQFLGEQYVIKLKDNNQLLLNKVIESSTFDSLKTQHMSNEFLFRKGIVGDWKSHFTKDESDLVDQKVDQMFSGTGLEKLWIEEMKWY